jgi:hypothetical protein
MLLQRRRERAAIPYRIAYLRQDHPHMFFGRRIHQETQRTIQVLAGAQHHRQLTRGIRHILPAQLATAA